MDTLGLWVPIGKKITMAKFLTFAKHFKGVAKHF
jgi:hypothetical protein